MKFAFNKALVAFLLSAFVITSTHSVVLASEHASASVGQASAPNADGLQHEIMRQGLLAFVRAAQASKMYEGEEGKVRFMKDLSKGLRFMKKEAASQFRALSDDEAQARWDQWGSQPFASDSLRAKFDQLDQDSNLSVQEKLAQFTASVSTKKIKDAVRAEIERAGSVSAALAEVEAEASQPGWTIKPSDIGKGIQYLFFGVLIVALIFSLGMMIYGVGSAGYQAWGIWGAILWPIGVIGGIIALELFIIWIGIFIADVASGKYDPPAEGQPVVVPAAEPILQ